MHALNQNSGWKTTKSKDRDPEGQARDGRRHCNRFGKNVGGTCTDQVEEADEGLEESAHGREEQWAQDRALAPRRARPQLDPTTPVAACGQQGEARNIECWRGWPGVSRTAGDHGCLRRSEHGLMIMHVHSLPSNPLLGTCAATPLSPDVLGGGPVNGVSYSDDGLLPSDGNQQHHLQSNAFASDNGRGEKPGRRHRRVRLPVCGVQRVPRGPGPGSSLLAMSCTQGTHTPFCVRVALGQPRNSSHSLYGVESLETVDFRHFPAANLAVSKRKR